MRQMNFWLRKKCVGLMLFNDKWGHLANKQKINPMSMFSQAVIFNYLQLLRSNIVHIYCLNFSQKSVSRLNGHYNKIAVILDAIFEEGKANFRCMIALTFSKLFYSQPQTHSPKKFSHLGRKIKELLLFNS